MGRPGVALGATVGGSGVGLSLPGSRVGRGEGAGVGLPLPESGEGWGEGAGVRLPLPISGTWSPVFEGEGWSEGDNRQAAGARPASSRIRMMTVELCLRIKPGLRARHSTTPPRPSAI